jgi:hypothetical protein
MFLIVVGEGKDLFERGRNYCHMAVVADSSLKPASWVWSDHGKGINDMIDRIVRCLWHGITFLSSYPGERGRLLTKFLSEQVCSESRVFGIAEGSGENALLPDVFRDFSIRKVLTVGNSGAEKSTRDAQFSHGRVLCASSHAPALEPAEAMHRVTSFHSILPTPDELARMKESKKFP